MLGNLLYAGGFNGIGDKPADLQGDRCIIVERCGGVAAR
jgi:hypothetical protein